MRIDVFADAVCPWCYIGRRRLERARAMRPAAQLDIHWRPFQLNPWMPAEGMSRAEYLAAKFGAVDADRVYDNVRRVGAGEGIAFDFDRIAHTPNTIDAHRAIRWARAVAGPEAEDALIEALFRAYFEEGEDIGDVAVLTGLVREAGLDGAAAAAHLLGDLDRDAVAAEDAKARQMGVQGVPCFIVEGRFAVSGAQEPEYFMPLFDLAATWESPVT